MKKNVKKVKKQIKQRNSHLHDSITHKDTNKQTKNDIALKDKERRHKLKEKPPQEEREHLFRKLRQDITNKIITEEKPSRKIDLSESYYLSRETLGEYVTLDWKHSEEIIRLTERLYDYVKDETRQRPYNVMMLAEPGSGKSHFVKCLAKYFGPRVEGVIFNMTAMRDLDDLTQPIDMARNLTVKRIIPLLFLDEFDSDTKNCSILLPLLWDGELNVGHRELRTGKVIIILSGSGVSIQEAMKASKGMQTKIAGGFAKLPDLFSRMNGGEIVVPRLDEVDLNNDRDRRTDKVCITIALLRNRFGDNLDEICWPLLSFVARSKFRYEARSIAHLVDCIQTNAVKAGRLHADNLGLPFHDVTILKAHSLAYHIIAEDGPAAVVDLWLKLKKYDKPVTFEHKLSRPWHARDESSVKES
ncbi:ATP-binding protein [Planctomycetota bacterium]